MKTRHSRHSELVAIPRIERTIVRLRGHNVMLDTDLAELYGVTTRRFNEQVKRNLDRFPGDFRFQLTTQEYASLRSQIATSSSASHGGRRYLPFAFTEHGAIMAATILNSRRAVQVSILVVRTFVGLRQMLQTHADLTRKLKALETKYDGQFVAVFDAIRELTAARRTRRRIGFRAARQ